LRAALLRRNFSRYVTRLHRRSIAILDSDLANPWIEIRSHADNLRPSLARVQSRVSDRFDLLGAQRDPKRFRGWYPEEESIAEEKRAAQREGEGSRGIADAARARFCQRWKRVRAGDLGILAAGGCSPWLRNTMLRYSNGAERERNKESLPSCKNTAILSWAHPYRACISNARSWGLVRFSSFWHLSLRKRATPRARKPRKRWGGGGAIMSDTSGASEEWPAAVWMLTSWFRSEECGCSFDSSLHTRETEDFYSKSERYVKSISSIRNFPLRSVLTINHDARTCPEYVRMDCRRDCSPGWSRDPLTEAKSWIRRLIRKEQQHPDEARYYRRNFCVTAASPAFIQPAYYPQRVEIADPWNRMHEGDYTRRAHILVQAIDMPYKCITVTLNLLSADLTDISRDIPHAIHEFVRYSREVTLLAALPRPGEKEHGIVSLSDMRCRDDVDGRRLVPSSRRYGIFLSYILLNPSLFLSLCESMMMINRANFVTHDCVKARRWSGENERVEWQWPDVRRFDLNFSPLNCRNRFDRSTEPSRRESSRVELSACSRLTRD